MWSDPSEGRSFVCRGAEISALGGGCIINLATFLNNVMKFLLHLPFVSDTVCRSKSFANREYGFFVLGSCN